MSDFVRRHISQLQSLNIPAPLFDSLESQLQCCFVAPMADDSTVTTSDEGKVADILIDLNKLIQACHENISVNLSSENSSTSDYGSMLVLPHICSWDMQQHPKRDMFDALQNLPVSVLRQIMHGLKEEEEGNYSLGHPKADGSDTSEKKLSEISPDDQLEMKIALVNEICRHPSIWSRVILYRASGGVRAALPSPPYFPQVKLLEATIDSKEADITGPFPFQYHYNHNDGGSGAGNTDEKEDFVVDCSLGYVSPGWNSEQDKQLPTIDLVPSYSVPNKLTRCIRYAALLGGANHAPEFCMQQAKEIYSNFVHNMHLARQKRLECDESNAEIKNEDPSSTMASTADNDSRKVWKVYTDPDDHMSLSHPEAGLSSSTYVLTENPEEADIIYSSKSVFAPGELKQALEGRPNVLINQFPFEGAMVQKDHLAREIWNQHGLPLPNWAIEAYDLDVQFGQFVGSAILAAERHRDDRAEDDKNNLSLSQHFPLWIIKPAKGTRSQGHVVTRSLAQVLRLIDSGGGSRIAQRYIENPVCYDGRKVDCRCLVMMNSANPPGKPTLFMHNHVYFRIASKQHKISEPSHLRDEKSILTAMHLIEKSIGTDSNDNMGDKSPSSSNKELKKLPVGKKTIAKLEQDYGEAGFDWNGNILPHIHTMIRELFNGMTKAYPKMGESIQSRGLYGLDLMFQIEESSSGSIIEPKLTEVTFFPANNAVCDSYERDDEVYRNYGTDVFDCMFLGKVNERITRIQ